MNSRASYFSAANLTSVPLPLVRENFRRFWAIPAVAFLAYFLSGTFPIILSYKNLSMVASYISASLANLNPVYMGCHLLVPIITAVLLFRYLQTVGSVTVLHSLPVNRPRLYNSTFLSGLVLSSLPVLANGIILLILAKPIPGDEYDFFSGMTASDVFTRGEVVRWIWQSLLIIFMIYAISVFAGIITGNSLMHFALALTFNFLAPALFSLFNLYFEEYLYGFDLSGNWASRALALSPFLEVFNRWGDVTFPALRVVLFLLASVLIILLSGYLYTRRKLERATDSIVFGFVIPILCCLAAFFGMSLFGAWFDFLGDGQNFYKIAGYVSGSLLFFIIARMLLLKTPRIFNLATLRGLGIYGLIALLFFGSMIFDPSGFVRRIPKAKNVESVSLSVSGFMHGLNTFDSYYSKREDGRSSFSRPENIEEVRKLHQALLAMKDNGRQIEKGEWVDADSICYIDYSLKGKGSLQREYYMDYKSMRDSRELAALYNSQEHKDAFILAKLAPSAVSTAEVSSVFQYNEKYDEDGFPVEESHPMASRRIEGSAAIKGLLAAVNADYRKSEYRDIVSLRPCFLRLTVEFELPDKKEKGYSLSGIRPSYEVFNVNIPPTFTNTLRWLDENGYAKGIREEDFILSKIEVFRSSDADDAYADAKTDALKANDIAVPVGEDDLRVITDPAVMSRIMKNAVSEWTGETEYRVVAYYSPKGNPQKVYYMDLFFVPEEVPSVVSSLFTAGKPGKSGK